MVTRPGAGRHASNAQRAVLRAARSAAALPLAAVAAASGVNDKSVKRALRATHSRGGCDRDAAQAYPALASAQRAAVLAGRWCPPALRRAAETDRSLKARRAGAGTASWASTTKEIAHAGPSAAALLATLSRPPRAGARHASQASGYTRLAAAADPDCAAAVLVRLVGDTSWRVRTAVASHRGCPPLLLAVLAASNKHEPRVRAAVASNPACPLDVFVRLGSEPNWHVRAGAAANPRRPLMLGRFVCDDHYLPRGAVAANPSCPPEMALALADDQDNRVRAALATNPNTDASLLRRLVRDRHPQVRSNATKTLRGLGEHPAP